MMLTDDGKKPTVKNILNGFKWLLEKNKNE